MSKSILNKFSSSRKITKDDIDGKTYINISSKGETELGKMLNPRHSNKFTIKGVGDFYSMESYMNFLTIQNYPDKLLTQPVVTRREFESFGKPIRRTLGNYYSLVTIGLYHKINQDDTLYQLFIENTLEYASVYDRRISISGVPHSEVDIKSPIPKMNRYVSIVRYLSVQFKKYGRNISDDILISIIDKTKDKPELKLTDGLS